mmetsp:Transcript_35640/g.75884  ORF Transcript_35640/g.75884 Transcript_35640/m.75884 type:complete len:212 (+) Transcript_35640:2655-3290(+)
MRLQLASKHIEEAELLAEAHRQEIPKWMQSQARWGIARELQAKLALLGGVVPDAHGEILLAEGSDQRPLHRDVQAHDGPGVEASGSHNAVHLLSAVKVERGHGYDAEVCIPEAHQEALLGTAHVETTDRRLGLPHAHGAGVTKLLRSVGFVLAFRIVDLLPHGHHAVAAAHEEALRKATHTSWHCGQRPRLVVEERANLLLHAELGTAEHD